MTSAEDHSRDEAYQLGDSDARRSYYDGWAASYDTDFADADGYTYPQKVALRFLDLAGKDDRPVADLGCGTGLAGVRFAGSGFDLDGFDISRSMLAEARKKGVYRELLAVDLTAPDGFRTGKYGGLISCGTFTLGHLGPDALEASLALARSGALCVIGINALHYSEAGFGERLECLAAAGQISPARIEQVPVYKDVQESSPVKLANLTIFRLIQ